MPRTRDRQRSAVNETATPFMNQIDVLFAVAVVVAGPNDRWAA
jgi:hypothetical protein